MKKFNLFLVFTATLLPALARAEITNLSASPDPVKQGAPLRIFARVDRAGTIYFFFKGRPFGQAVNASRPGLYSTLDAVPGNTVPAGKNSIDKAYGAQQFGHRVSDFVTVTR